MKLHECGKMGVRRPPCVLRIARPLAKHIHNHRRAILIEVPRRSMKDCPNETAPAGRDRFCITVVLFRSAWSAADLIS